MAACLCIVGFWHVYLNVRPSQERIARLMLVAFALLMVFGGAIHVLWATRGFALKYCYGSDDAAVGHECDSSGRPRSADARLGDLRSIAVGHGV